MAGVADRIRLHRCEQDRLGVAAQADFALTFMMIHEVPDQRRLRAKFRVVEGGREAAGGRTQDARFRGRRLQKRWLAARIGIPSGGWSQGSRLPGGGVREKIETPPGLVQTTVNPIQEDHRIPRRTLGLLIPLNPLHPARHWVSEWRTVN